MQAKLAAGAKWLALMSTRELNIMTFTKNTCKYEDHGDFDHYIASSSRDQAETVLKEEYIGSCLRIYWIIGLWLEQINKIREN